jgi:hypothetical protein
MGLPMMRDELIIEEMSTRATQEKMDNAFREAVHRAIRAGHEFVPTVALKHLVIDDRKRF